MVYRDDSLTVVCAEEERSGRRIPDEGGAPVRCVLEVTQPGEVRRITVTLDLTHGSVSDLVVSLSAPSGRRILLYNQHAARGSAHALRFDSDHFAGLSPLLGEPAGGRWELVLKDAVGGDTGELDRWSLRVEIAPPRP